MKTILNIEGMSCEHCVKHITEALQALGGIKSVKVNLKKKTAELDHGEGVSLETMKAAVKEEGYTVV